jgi:hypothetical protein
VASIRRAYQVIVGPLVIAASRGLIGTRAPWILRASASWVATIR